MKIWRTTVEVAVQAETAAEADQILARYLDELTEDGSVVEVVAGPGWTEEPHRRMPGDAGGNGEVTP